MRAKTLGVIALILCAPGGIPIACAVWGYRAYARFKARREIGRELAQRGVTTVKRPRGQA
jgi:hypothetical protein